MRLCTYYIPRCMIFKFEALRVYPKTSVRITKFSEREHFYYMWTFGWSYETATAMARLVFSKITDSYPNLKIITLGHLSGQLFRPA
jgi:predicted TIM-barrel fold metal-dependent hydrolase